MKSSTKRIMMSVLTLVMTVVALGTTTFAWFSLSNVATINNISGSVQAGDGLEVRLSGDKNDTEIYEGVYRNNLSGADWTDLLTNLEVENFAFGAVTSPNGESFEILKQVNESSDLKLNELLPADGKNKEYLEFRVDFRSLQAGSVHLTGINFEDSEDVAWNNHGGEAYKQYGETKTNYEVKTSPRNAARVAFFNSKDESKLNIFQESAGATDNNGYVLGTNSYQGNNFSTTTPVLFGQWSFLKSKGVVIKNANDVVIDDDFTGVTLAEARDVKEVTASENEQGFSIELEEPAEDNGYYNASVTLRIWIEGWDADTYDSIFGSELKVNLSFTKVS